MAAAVETNQAVNVPEVNYNTLKQEFDKVGNNLTSLNELKQKAQGLQQKLDQSLATMDAAIKLAAQVGKGDDAKALYGESIQRANAEKAQIQALISQVESKIALKKQISTEGDYAAANRRVQELRTDVLDTLSLLDIKPDDLSGRLVQELVEMNTLLQKQVEYSHDLVLRAQSSVPSEQKENILSQVVQKGSEAVRNFAHDISNGPDLRDQMPGRFWQDTGARLLRGPMFTRLDRKLDGQIKNSFTNVVDKASIPLIDGYIKDAGKQLSAEEEEKRRRIMLPILLAAENFGILQLTPEAHGYITNDDKIQAAHWQELPAFQNSVDSLVLDPADPEGKKKIPGKRNQNLIKIWLRLNRQRFEQLPYVVKVDKVHPADPKKNITEVKFKNAEMPTAPIVPQVPATPPFIPPAIPRVEATPSAPLTLEKQEALRKEKTEELLKRYNALVGQSKTYDEVMADASLQPLNRTERTMLEQALISTMATREAFLDVVNDGQRTLRLIKTATDDNDLELLTKVITKAEELR